ncbi:MAG TPA: SIMPL domain-containing protein [Microcoleaceae cyanobacterium]|jgi:hypothetical protein
MNYFLSNPERNRAHAWKLLAVAAGCLSLLTAAPGFAAPVLTSTTIAQTRPMPERMLRTITVTGRGTEMVATSLTLVRLGVEAQGKTAEEVQQQVAQRSNAVINLLKSRNVEKLETTGINLSPTYRYDNGTQTLTGYTASNIVSFRIATSQAGTLMDDAVKAGATRIDGVSFVATDDAIATAQKAALREATQDARTQADAVLSSLGFTAQEIVGIQVNGAYAPPPHPVPMAGMAKQDFASTPVIGGDQQVEASVTLQISY